jgi:hypothetical protein
MDSLYQLVVAAPVIGLAAYCVTQIFVARLATSSSPYRSLMIGFICGLVVVMMLAGWAAGRMEISVADRIGYLLLDLLTYLALAFGYFNFVNLTVASLRIRLLEELSLHGGRLSRQALVDRHSSANVFGIRLKRLIGGGHLVEQQGRLFTGKRVFLVVARIFDMLRWVILGRRTPEERAADASWS